MNKSIEKINLESNNIQPHTLAKIFESINVHQKVGNMCCQCCRSGMIYYESNIEFSDFRVRIQVRIRIRTI